MLFYLGLKPLAKVRYVPGNRNNSQNWQEEKNKDLTTANSDSNKICKIIFFDIEFTFCCYHRGREYLLYKQMTIKQRTYSHNKILGKLGMIFEKSDIYLKSPLNGLQQGRGVVDN